MHIAALVLIGFSLIGIGVVLIKLGRKTPRMIGTRQPGVHRHPPRGAHRRVAKRRHRIFAGGVIFLIVAVVLALVYPGIANAKPTPRFAGYVALSFDDGPDTAVTPYILDVLKAKRATATFFVQGNHAESAPAVVRRAAAEGHQIGNHTWSHPYMPHITGPEQIAEIDRVGGWFAGQGIKSTLFRYPHGASTEVADKYLAANGMTSVLWYEQGISDWTCPNEKTIIRRATQSLFDGAIILLHDGNEATACGVRAYRYLPNLIDQLRARGFVIGRISVTSDYNALNRSYARAAARA